MSKIFPPSPELDWLKELSDPDAEILGLSNLERDQIFEVYSFLLWFGRMRKAKPNSREYLVAYGYTLRYREAVYRVQLTDAERKSAQMAEIGYAELKAERKKNAK